MAPTDNAGDDRPLPFDLIGVMAIQEAEVADGLRHVEIYTRGGLLTLFWHGDPTARSVLVMGGGAMGGMLGPANGLYHDLGVELARQGCGAIRVGWRVPNDLGECILDMAAAADLASRGGAQRFITAGHSFGGAVAVGAAIALPTSVAGVVTFATQSAGCENAARLGGRPLLLFHGDRDTLLPPMCSEVVKELAGGGELVVIPGTGHLLAEGRDLMWEKLLDWIPATFNSGT